MTTLLRLEQITKHFFDEPILKSISCSINSGKITALLGENGAGKSTLIKIITGIHQPDSGSLYWQNKKIVIKNPQQARKLGIETVYQDLALVDHLALWRNFFLGRELVSGPFQHLDSARMRAITAEQIAKFRLSRCNDPTRLVNQLSGGERQAIAICRAMYFRTPLLILDEPTSALSYHQAALTHQYLQQAAESGIAVLLITHRIDQLNEFVHHKLILHKGCLLTDDLSASDLKALFTRESHYETFF